MSKSGFSSGFFLGALVGGAIGGVIGAVVATRQGDTQPNRKTTKRSRALNGRDDDDVLLHDDEDTEATRRHLENKIARLNETIDDVRQQLQVVHDYVPNVNGGEPELALDEMGH